MPEMEDMALVRDYVTRNSEEAFGALVKRHVNLVYSVALRQTGNPHVAQEITQAVFIILARKAKGLSRQTVLSGWLYQTARLTAKNFLRSEMRRVRREQDVYMQSLTNQTEPDFWPQIAPLLEDAMGRLGEKDRNAIVLRFLEGRNLRDVGKALGASEDAAKMRINRALEKLRNIFTKRGVALTTAIIAGAVSANSVQAAPVGLAAAITGTAVQGSAVSASALALAEGVLKLMAWAKAKTAIMLGVGTLAVGTMVVMVKDADLTRLGGTPSFRPAREFILDYSGRTSCVDVDTDRLLAEFKGGTAAFENWKETNGVDVAMIKLSDGKEGVSVSATALARVHNSAWTKATAEEVTRFFSLEGPGSDGGVQNTFIEGGGNYMIRTREGAKGIIQISVYNPYPRSVRVRYKMVQTATSK